jgi:hypothetical protein
MRNIAILFGKEMQEPVINMQPGAAQVHPVFFINAKKALTKKIDTELQNFL